MSNPELRSKTNPILITSCYPKPYRKSKDNLTPDLTPIPNLAPIPLPYTQLLTQPYPNHKLYNNPIIAPFFCHPNLNRKQMKSYDV